MPRALVTGSAGFVGSHFSARLRADGWDVHGLDIAHGPEFDVRPWFRRHKASFDLVIHCAAIVGGRAQIEGDPLSLAANLEIDAALFGWARRTRPGRVVYFSSSAAYPVGLQDGTGRYRLCEEDIRLDAPDRPDTLYGWAKITGEYLARLARAEGVPVTVVRPFSGYGSDQDATYPFPAFIDRALRREDPFTIWGDGNQVRDFIHIDDIVNTVQEMAVRGMDGPVNLGWGLPVPMTELARMACDQAGYAPEFKTTAAAPSGVAWRVANPARMMAVRSPRVTLAEGISRALEDRKRKLRP